MLICLGENSVFRKCAWEHQAGECLIPEEAKARILKMSHECQRGNPTRIAALSVISFSLSVLSLTDITEILQPGSS